MYKDSRRLMAYIGRFRTNRRHQSWHIYCLCLKDPVSLRRFEEAGTPAQALDVDIAVVIYIEMAGIEATEDATVDLVRPVPHSRIHKRCTILANAVRHAQNQLLGSPLRETQRKWYQ